MLFDKLCGVVERHLPHLRDAVQQSRLFLFQAKPHEVLPEAFKREEMEALWDNFALPFDAVAIEDPCTCTVLTDKVPNQTGFGDDRLWIDIIDGDPERAKTAFPKDETEAARGIPKDGLLVTWGVIKSDWPWQPNSKLFWNVGVLGGAFILGDRCEDVTEEVSASENRRTVSRNPITACEEVMYFNAPNRFIVEATPERVRDGRSAPKIPRSHERPMFTLLTPDEVRKIIPRQEHVGSHASPAPHERRRHLRTLRSDRFVNMQGRTITIPASWVGPTEATVGRKLYKVRIDL